MNFLTCTVRGCRYRFSRRLPRSVSLYMLPRDAPDELKQGWRQVCKGRLVACSEHFTNSDFLRRKESPESNGKSRPLKHNVVPKMKLQMKESVRKEDSSRRQKNEEIITLNSEEGPEKEVSDPLAEDILQEEDENTNAIKCQVTEPSKENPLKDSMYYKVVLKEDSKRIHVESGPIEARIETSEASSSRATPSPCVLVKVVPGKPPQQNVPDAEKKSPQVVIKEVKLARKKFEDALARHKVAFQKPHTVQELLQGKDITVRKRGREDEAKSVPEGVKHPKVDELKISSVASMAKGPEDKEAGEKSPENPNISGNYSFAKSLRKGRRKQVFRPGSGSEKLIPVPVDEDSLPEEEQTPEQPPEEPPEKLPEKPPETEDDDVIFLPQKIDVIDIEDDSDEEEPRPSSATANTCDPTMCKYLPKILEDNRVIVAFLSQKEKLKSQRTVLQTNNQNILMRHTAAQDFLTLVPRVLSSTQKNIIFEGNDPIVWKPDEIRNALVLKYLSEDVYMYLRQVLIYPLPSLDSLQKWEEQYPDESVKARSAAREYEKTAEEDIEEEDESERGVDDSLLWQVITM